MFKLSAAFLVGLLIFSCSKDGGGANKALKAGSSNLTEAQVIKEEVRVLKEELVATDHQLEKEELSALLEDGLLSEEDQLELAALAKETKGADHE